jgi:acyl transferase domain-containing protein
MSTHDAPRLSETKPRLAVLYNSRESLWAGMTPHLYAAEGALEASLAASETQIRKHLGWSLRDELEKRVDDDSLAAAEFMLEPALAAIQMALTDAWRERGVVPDAVAGRSGSEVVAGYARGLLTHDEAIELACRASLVMCDSRAAGRLVRVTLALKTVEAIQASAPVPFHIVTDAWSDITMIACDVPHVDPLIEFFRAHGADDCRVEPMLVGAHSPLMDPAREEFVRPLESASTRVQSTARLAGYTPAIETVYQDVSQDAAYWWDLVLRRPLRLRAHVRRMVHDGYSVFLEIGTRVSYDRFLHDVDTELGTKSLPLATMRRMEPLQPVMDESLATLARLGLVRP